MLSTVLLLSACISLLCWALARGIAPGIKAKSSGGKNLAAKTALSVDQKKPNGKPASMSNGRNGRSHAYQPIPSMPNQWMPDVIPSSAEVTYVHHTLQRSLGSLPRASPRLAHTRITPPGQIPSPLPPQAQYRAPPAQLMAAASPIYGTLAMNRGAQMPGRNGSLTRREASYATATLDSRTGSIRSEMSSFK
jgi:hypothetical protein